MAEDELEPEEGGEDSPVVEEVQENITKAQYLGILGLFLSIIYLYVVWPFTASKEIDLKEPNVYIAAGRDLFKLAHGERAFPRDDRLNTLQEVTWNYETSIRAGADLEMEDRYRWGYASYNVQMVRNPNSRYAMVTALDNFILALKLIEAKVPGMAEAKGEQYLEMKRILNELPVKREKVKFLLASAYMRVGRYEKAIPLLKDLQKIEHEYKLFQRRRDRLGLALNEQGPIELGASPYRMQLSELQKVNLLLGQAYEKNNQPDEAIQALDAYLESTRAMELAELDVDTGANMESRYMALKTLAGIHFGEYRHARNDLKKLRANKAALPDIQAKMKTRDHHLDGALEKLSQLFVPAYSVYGLEDEQLMYLEVAYRLGMMDNVLKMSDSFESADPHKRNEKKLWKIMARLKGDKTAPVTPELTSIASDNTDPHIKLAALVLLGDNQVENGMVDKALGGLIPEYENKVSKSDVGSYFRSVFKYKEEDFDENNFIGKLKLIDATMQRANKAKEDGDEKLSIKLYRFLLEHFTVPKATVLHEIAGLKRTIGQKKREEQGLTEDVKAYFKDSAEHYLMTENFEDVPYDQKAREESYYQAAESYFEGGFYTNAYENYGVFIEERPEDSRISKARHKKGVSALYRKGSDTRLQDARKEFLDNISIGLRSVDTNNDLPNTLMVGSSDDLLAIDKILTSQEFYARISEVGELNDQADLNQALFDGKVQDNKTLNDLLNSEYFKSKIISLGNLQQSRQDLNALILGGAKELMSLDNLLQNSAQGSRDIWAYQSLYELARTYQAEHRYGVAGKVYERIKNDRRFSPKSEIWKDAAYANAKMTYNRVSERKEPRPWEEAIGVLEDILTLYDLEDFNRRFSPKDTDLYEDFRRDNGELKYLLAKAYLNNEDATNAKQQCLDLLNQKKYYNISLMPGQTEATQMVTEQKTKALLGDAYYELGDFKNAMESYRQAHDQNLGSWERPFYSLSIVDCLIGMNRYDDAKNRLKRTKWELDQLYKDDEVVFAEEDLKFGKEEWLALVEKRMELIP